MARPSLPIGSWGNISTKQQKNGRFRARARFRDHDGVTRSVEAWGNTITAAETRLREALTARAKTSGGDMSPTTRLKALADLWLRDVVDHEHADHKRRLSTNTRQRYREIAEKKIVPVAGNLMLQECTVRRMNTLMDRFATEYGPATANLCRSVLAGMFRYAVTDGGLDANPIKQITPISTKAPEVRVLSAAEVRRFRADLRADKRAVRADLPALVDVLLGSGCRIGEAAALRLDDVDLKTGFMMITGTVVRSKKDGLIRQEMPKDKEARPARLPEWALESVRAHLASGLVDTSQGLVFPTATGGLREVSTMNNQWRKFRGRNPMWEWTTFHTLRKTVATAIERKFGIEVAAEVLGHAGSATTAAHYVKASDAPDVRSALERFSA